MADTIYLLQDGGTLQEMTMASYDSELVLQELLERYPDLLAGAEIDQTTPRRWLLVRREQGVADHEQGGSRWAVDHLFLDQDGVPTLVEVKRSSDTRIRREVVGQMLDYAANAVVYWPVEDIRREYEKRCVNESLEPIDEWQQRLETELDYDDYWAQVETNLRAGRIRMLFLADEIPRELRRVVEFLNEQMDPADVLAVEVKQYVGEGLKTLVPRLIGQTSASEVKKGKPGKQWDEEMFFTDLKARHTESAVKAVRRLYQWSQSHFTILWGRGKQDGSFVPSIKIDGIGHNPFAVFSSGQFYPYFEFMKQKEQFKEENVRRHMLERLNEIPGVQLPSDGIDRRPPIMLDVLGEGDNVELLIRIFEEEYLSRLGKQR
ncbi:MAG TPA: hypothetical protein ENH10_09825 [Bacteroidetes bacterium]|nr:hypothetical protein BMS3Bbin04_01148 [bacterium BMS3Bbin04]HDO66306.1 hypothetical protein [Bacteroidota bacterium]HEX05431.1 hypothetical protein [Bacteroidota bacterium]